MEGNLFKCCIPSCFSSKTRCPCRLKKFKNRVSPSKPVIFTVTKGMSPSPESDVHAIQAVGSPGLRSAPALQSTPGLQISPGLQSAPGLLPPGEQRHHSKFNGQANLYYQEDDEVSLSNGKLDEDTHLNGNHKSSELNGDLRLPDVTAEGHKAEGHKTDLEGHSEERINVGEEPESSLTQGFYQFLSTVFIQLSKSKKLRVIHIKSNENEESVQKSLSDINSGGGGGISNSNSDEEDDDYWFTKWSRRPKLKNTFKPNSISKKSRRETIMEINARTTITYEEIKELNKHKVDEESGDLVSTPTPRLRKMGSIEIPNFSETRDSPPRSPCSPCSPGIPGSPDCPDNGHKRLSFDGNELSKPSDNYDTEWPGSDETFQQDLDPSGDIRNVSPPSLSAFTNYAFQLDPEDFANEDYENKTEAADCPNGLNEHNLGMNGNLNLANENSVFPVTLEPIQGEIIKSNGFGPNGWPVHQTIGTTNIGTTTTPTIGTTTTTTIGTTTTGTATIGAIHTTFGAIGTIDSPTSIESIRTNGHVTQVLERPSPERLSPECPSPDSISTKSVTIDNSKPLLFFIHGISGSSDVWKAQFKYFHEQGYEIVAPDLLGHGLSSTPDKAKYYFFESLVQDLVAVFDHFVTETRRSVIIGHGYGACMGAVLSRIRSDNVSLLISVGGGGPTPLVPYGCLDRPFLPIRLNFRKKKSIGRFDNPDLKHVLPVSIHHHILNGQLWVDGDASFHRRISVPTLLVYGMRDTVVSLIEECEMERTIPKAFLELLPTAGHMVMWDDPTSFNRMLRTFIESWADSHT